MKGTHPRQHDVAGDIGGFQVRTVVERSLGKVQISITLQDAPDGDVFLQAKDLQGVKADALVARLENRLGRFEKIRDQTVAAIDRHRTEAARAREAIGAPFPDAEALTTARDRVAGLKAELDKLAATLPEYNPTLAKEAIEGALGVHGSIDADNVVTFVLADGRTGTVAPGPDDQYPYQVRIADIDGNAPAQTDAVLAEVPDAVRLLARDPYLPESTAVALQARTHPVEVAVAQQAHMDGPSAAQLAAVALASVSMPSTMSQRLGARSGTAKAPRQQPPQPPRPMSPETER